MAYRRLIKEYRDWRKDPDPNVFMRPDSDNLFLWKGAFEGPVGTPYEHGMFQFQIDFPKDYPFRPPKILVKTKIHHINVNEKGEAWIFPSDQWSPALTARRGLITLMGLIKDPDVELAMDQATYDEWADHRKSFNEKARQLTETYTEGRKSDWEHLHQDEDWDRDFLSHLPAPATSAASTTTASTTSTTSATTAGPFTFGITPSTSTSTSAAPAPSEAQSHQALAASLERLRGTKERLRLEYQDLLAWSVPCVVAAPSPEDVLHWTGVVDQLEGTPYEHGLFWFDIVFNADYGIKPVVKFKTQIYHPNIVIGSNINVTENWSANTSVASLLEAVVSLIKQPRTHSFSNNAIGQEYQLKRSQFEQTAREWTRKYAIGE